MIKKVERLYKKNKEFVNYAIFGVLSTLLNFAIYVVCSKIFIINYQASNVIAWIICIIFVFITNRKYVFKGEKGLKWEMFSFIFCRIATLLLETFILWLFVKKIGMNDVIIKIIANLIVIITNYILSKLVIFRKNREK